MALTLSRSPERVRDLVDGAGWAAPLLFVPVSALLSCAFFPGPLLAAASGLLFGAVAGTPVAIVAATASASLAFLISRHGGRAAAEGIAGERVLRWRDWVDRRGFVAVLYARIAPLAPFTLINYAAGLTRLPILVFAAATAVGVAPRAFAWATLGGSFEDLSSPEAIIAVAVLVGMALLGVLLVLRDRRRNRRGAAAPSAAGP